MTKKTSYEELIEKALENAAEDRGRAVEAFDKTKEVYDINIDDKETMAGLMLLGQSIPKLLELAHKANEQIIKLAQLREKEAARTAVKDDGERKPFDVAEIMAAGKAGLLDKNN